jgi:hypothetical protein
MVSDLRRMGILGMLAREVVDRGNNNNNII